MFSFLVEEVELVTQRLNNNEDLKFMPFGKIFHLYDIWEVTLPTDSKTFFIFGLINIRIQKTTLIKTF